MGLQLAAMADRARTGCATRSGGRSIPSGFVGAFPRRLRPDVDEHRLARHRRVARPRDRPGRLGTRAGAGVRLPHPRLRHHRPLPDRPAPGRRRRLRPADRRGPRRAACGCCSTGCSTTSAPTSRATAQAVDRRDPEAAGWFRGRPGRFHTFEGHDDLITLNHAQPRRRRLHRRGDDRTGWAAAPTAGASMPPTRYRESFWAQVLPRVRAAHPDAWFVAEVIHGDYSGVRRRVRRRLGDPVRTVEGDLEQPQRRQLPRTGLGAAAPQRHFWTPSPR